MPSFRPATGYRIPDHVSGWKCAKHVLLGQVIERIDHASGLTMPFIIFAYRKLNRSVSARSSQRFSDPLVCVDKTMGNRRALHPKPLGQGTG
jgi:hypothetical protein